ncbi:PD-(D/E)XK nuclease family protein [Hymenobacter koreensis]|uniref:PD-(D/E)XK nuclease family protein n=1 Tax=Hymenobacter koreensis TaxID=1084523 RepID=A0ABP8IY75_9BACT
MVTNQCVDAERYGSVVDSITEFYRRNGHRRQHALLELIPAITQHAAVNREYNRLTSAEINLFRFFAPGETTHSRLLAFFLNPRSQHGQGGLFLEEFLKVLGIRQPQCGAGHTWTVTAEQGRIDVLLKRAHPHAVVVIENKSNYAVDQPHQLYRYWYREIHRQQVSRHRSAEEIAQPPKDSYRMVYLAPAAWKRPDEQSMRKPKEWERLTWAAHLPEVIPMEPEQHLFPDLVVQWLSNALPRLPVDNHRLREFTLQYLQFWKAH